MGKPGFLHLNACGDFTLMTRSAWHELRGYPEWGLFSWNLDSLLLYQAAAAGFGFVALASPALHLEHSSGWTPEAHLALFDGLAARGVPLLNDADLVEVAYAMWKRRRRGEWRMNLDGWGMAAEDFVEAADSAA